MAAGAFVSYLRVSTDKQGQSGLGLEAQRAAVESYLNGGNWRLIREYVEVESGKRAKRGKTVDRPQLRAALAHAKSTGATLVIAKLDRLARNVAVIANLMESGVPFVAVDRSNAKAFELHIYAALAQEEGRMISERTRAALAAAKARGVKLGNPNGARALRGKQIGNDAAIAAVRANAQRHAESVLERIGEVREMGATSYGAIARALNERGVMTPRGGAWHPASVKRVLQRGTGS